MRFFDLHCDTLFECAKTGCGINTNTLAVSLAQGAAFDAYIQTFAIFIPDDEPAPYALYERILSVAKAAFSKNADAIPRIKSARDLPRRGMGAILSVEGGRVLEGNLDRLDRLYADGVRMLTLTWNGHNEIASGAHSVGGLTPFGRRVIERMNALGMAVDLSHLNRESFFDALPLCKFPAASHSCFSAVRDHPRNLTDEQFAAIAKSGGVVGLCLYPEFLGDGNPFEQIYRHITHALSLGGEDTLAIGSDFDGAKMHPSLCKLAQIPDLFDYLHKKGVPSSALIKIFCKNAMNFYTKVLTNHRKCGML